jgi:hypothetical protein
VAETRRKFDEDFKQGAVRIVRETDSHRVVDNGPQTG